MAGRPFSEKQKKTKVGLAFFCFSIYQLYDIMHGMGVIDVKRKSASPGTLILGDSIQDAVARAIADDSAIESMLFDLDVLEYVEENMLDFVGCVFRKVQFSQINVQRVHFSNCRFEQCDLSGLPFRDGTLTRVEFVDCRGTGCSFDRMKMKDVLYQHCQLNYLTIASCKMERVEILDCDLSNAMLFESSQKDLVIDKCRLRSAEIQRTPLNGVDLSECDLEGIRMSADSLRGATIQLAQAPMILGLYGINVKI